MSKKKKKSQVKHAEEALCIVYTTPVNDRSATDKQLVLFLDLMTWLSKRRGNVKVPFPSFGFAACVCMSRIRKCYYHKLWRVFDVFVGYDEQKNATDCQKQSSSGGNDLALLLVTHGYHLSDAFHTGLMTATTFVGKLGRLLLWRRVLNTGGKPAHHKWAWH